MSNTPSATTPLLELRHLRKAFGGETVVRDVSLSLDRGSFHALLGPSGCGKTTIMRMIAGFETPDSGQILLDGEDLAGVPPHHRPVNMMFQSYALFPHLSVAANIGFGLEMAGASRAEIGNTVEDLLALVHLEGLGGRKPEQLSGGQKQRVALARALARKPKLLLLDEPLGALDRRLRDAMQLELKSLQQQLGISFLVVTHDQDEALSLSDRLAVMDRGQIAQHGTPQEIYEKPATLAVARFIGEFNLLDHPQARGLVIRPGEFIGWRPEKTQLSGDGLRLEGKVEAVSYRGDHTIIQFSGDDGRFILPLGSAEAAGLVLTPDARITCIVPHEALVRIGP